MMSVFAKGGIKYFMSMINSLQIILHLPILSVSFPASIMAFYKTIVPFVMFDIIELSEHFNNEFKSKIHFENEELDVLLITDQT